MPQEPLGPVATFFRYLFIVMATVLVIFFLFGGRAQGQSQSQIVFASAYERSFTITGCTNASPIVVTIAAPGASAALTHIPLSTGILTSISGVTGNTNCNVTDNAITVINPTSFSLDGTSGNGTYVNGGTGFSNTINVAEQPSIVLPNQGQGGHLVAPFFPDAGPGGVGPIQVRLEAAYTCPDPPFCTTADWRPIMLDITETFEVQGGTYNLEKSNGTWPALRVNSIVITPTSQPLRVDYTGSPFPFGEIIRNVTGPVDNRTIFPDNPYGTGGSGGPARMTFVLCLGTACTTGTNVTNRFIVTQTTTLSSCRAQAKTAPTGADLIFDINLNGVTPITTAPNRVTIEDGFLVSSTVTTFDTGGAVEDDFYTIDIDQVGSGFGGQDVSVVCEF